MDIQHFSVLICAFQTLASLIADYVPSPEKATLVSTAMHRALKSIGEGPFMTRKIREMLLEGYSLQPYVDLIIQIANENNIAIPLPLPEDPRFGYFYGVRMLLVGDKTLKVKMFICFFFFGNRKMLLTWENLLSNLDQADLINWVTLENGMEVKNYTSGMTNTAI